VQALHDFGFPVAVNQALERSRMASFNAGISQGLSCSAFGARGPRQSRSPCELWPGMAVAESKRKGILHCPCEAVCLSKSVMSAGAAALLALNHAWQAVHPWATSNFLGQSVNQRVPLIQPGHCGSEGSRIQQAYSGLAAQDGRSVRRFAFQHVSATFQMLSARPLIKRAPGCDGSVHIQGFLELPQARR